MPAFISTAHLLQPLTLWADLAVKTQEMLLSSGSVIQIRTQRMARAGLAPNAVDVAEFQLMGQEKLTAASESGAAMVRQLHSTHVTLANRAAQHWLASATALFSLASSITPAQAAERSGEFVQATARSIATTSQFSSAPARLAQQALEPIHAKATANALRLAALQQQA